MSPTDDNAARDAELQKARIGAVVPRNSTIELSPYDPAWPAMFESEAAKIRAALGERALAIHHAGSTSVPGLSAKPIIDIVLEVADTTDERSYVSALEAAGYVLRIREPEWFEHRLLKGENPAVNMHVFSAGCSETRRMLAFRDWLRDHDDDRALYQNTKTELAARVWRHTQDYADAKSEVVGAIMGRALAGTGL
jgi:GrpB-like predicted nucleotidyltransferase (UPF0157 family)